MTDYMTLTMPQTYRKYITYDKYENLTQYIKLEKATCGLLNSVLLYCMELWKELKSCFFAKFLRSMRVIYNV